MYGWTPLHFAAASGHLQVTNMKDYWGYNPLDLAIKFDYLHVKKHLEEVGYISNEINHGVMGRLGCANQARSRMNLTHNHTLNRIAKICTKWNDNLLVKNVKKFSVTCATKALGGFHLVALIIRELKSHLIC